MENSNDKGRPAGNGNVSPSRDVKRKGVNACRGSAYSPTRKRSLPYPFYKPAVFSPGGLSSLPLHAAPSAYRYIPFHAVRFRIAQRAAMRNTRAVKQRFQFALFALGHLFCVIRGVPWWCPQSDQSTQCTAMNILLIACMATKAGTRPGLRPDVSNSALVGFFGDGLS